MGRQINFKLYLTLKVRDMSIRRLITINSKITMLSKINLKYNKFLKKNHLKKRLNRLKISVNRTISSPREKNS